MGSEEIEKKKKKNGMKKCNGHLGLAKVDFLQGVPHLDFHLLNQLANVCDVRVAVINRLVGGLNLDEHNNKLVKI